MNVEAVMLCTNIALVIITALYVLLTWKILRSQTDPCVIVYARRDRENYDKVAIVIENVGNGIARDIRIEPEAQAKIPKYGSDS